MKRGVPQGPALGVAIAAAEQAWIAAGFPGDQSALDAIAADALRGVRSEASEFIADPCAHDVEVQVTRRRQAAGTEAEAIE